MNMEEIPKMNCNVPELWQIHKSELFRFIFNRVKDKELAKDISQDVLLKVYAFCSAKSGVNNLRSWLFQIAHNTIIDHYRKQSKFVAEENLQEVTFENEEEAFSEASNYILTMLNFLPEKYAVPLKLSDIDNLKQADIARQLNLKLSTTKSRIQRARDLLKAEFITCCHFETDMKGNIISFDIKENCEPLLAMKKEFQK
jgi:RNA polymerase sigma-70 factor, ECF subfamily